MLLTALVSIGTQVGVPRIVRAVRIPHPLGDPTLSIETERHLRRRLLLKAFEAMGKTVEGPTVFELQEVLI